MPNDSDEELYYIWSETEERARRKARKDFLRWTSGPRQGEAKLFTEADVLKIVAHNKTLCKYTGVTFRAIPVREVSNGNSAKVDSQDGPGS